MSEAVTVSSLTMMTSNRVLVIKTRTKQIFVELIIIAINTHTHIILNACKKTIRCSTTKTMVAGYGDHDLVMAISKLGYTQHDTNNQIQHRLLISD